MEFVLVILAILVVVWLWHGLLEISEELAKHFFPSNEDIVEYAPYILALALAAIGVFIFVLFGVPWQWTVPCSIAIASLIGHARLQFKATIDRQEAIRRKKRAREMYTQYENNPYLINDPQFRKEFFRVGGGFYSWDVKDSSRTDGPTVYGRMSGWECKGCGKMIYDRRQAHVDHIKPRSKYPHLAYLRSNLQILCARCNAHKGAYDGDDWREEIKSRKKRKAVQRRKSTLKARKEGNSNG